jgi:hypothetical protein
MTTPVIVDSTNSRVVVSGMIGPAPISTLSGLSDLDVTNLAAGSLLAYNASTNKWVAVNTLNQGQSIEPGQY